MREILHCNCNNIYSVTLMNCLEQYVGFATNFKSRFRIPKSDIKTNKEDVGRQSILLACVKMITIFF